jgi:hypothetical protein
MNYLQKLKGAYVITDLTVWQFEADPIAISHIAEQISKAIIVAHSMGNFGPDVFHFKRVDEDEME